MRVIMLSTDRSIFRAESAARRRMEEYAELFDELHIIVFSKRSAALEPVQVNERLWLYPTNSRSKLSYIRDAIRLGSALSLPDVVSSQDPFETGLAGAAIARFHKTKLLVQVHTDLESPEFRRHSFLNRLRYFIAPRVLLQASCIRVVSERIKQSLQATRYKIQTTPVVLPIPIEKRTYEHREGGGGKRVLTVARLEPEKDVATVLRAFALTAGEYVDATLTIVGDGSERRSLERLAARLGIQEKVMFAGAQPDVASYYSAADVFLAASRYEGYGMTLLEAAQAGLPIVTTDVGAVGHELPHEAVSACPPGDTAGLAAGLAAVFRDSEKAQHMAVLGKQAASRASRQEEYLTGLRTLFDACG